MNFIGVKIRDTPNSKRHVFTSEKKLSFKNIRKAIITSFVLAFFFAIGLVLLLNFFISKRENDVQAIILVSRQQVLSQKVLEKIYAATIHDSLDSEIRKDAQEWVNIHRAFQYGNPTMDIAAPLDDEKQILLADIADYQQRLFELTTQQNLSELSEKELEEIREWEIKFSYGMDNLLFGLQKDFQKKLSELKYVVGFSTFLFVLFIMGLYKFFVKPIFNSVRLLSEEKKQQAQFITSIIENTNEQIWAIDNKYGLMGYNSAFFEKMRLKVGLAPKREDNVLCEHYLFEKSSKVKELYDRALAGDNFHIEIEVCENEKTIYYELSFNPTYGEKKLVIGCSVYQRDITQRIEALKRLQQSESYLREAQEISKLGYWNWDIIEDKITWSDQLYKIFEKEPHKFTANYENLIEVIHREDRTAFEESVRKCIECHQPHDLAHRIILENGDIRYVHQRGKAYYDENNCAIRMAGTTLDITFIEEAKQQISRQYNELQNFVYIISHNVRGPISLLQGLTNLYKLDKKANIPMIMANLNKTVDALDSTIIDLNNALHLKNVDKNDFEQVNLAEILKNIQVQLASELDKCEAKIEADFTDAPQIFGITSYVNNILYNLILNALNHRAVNRNPLICLYSKSSSKNSIQIVIKDNGKGMALNEVRRKRIFDMYGKLDSTIEGKGLGLYLVKTQIEVLNGAIEVQSELDRGTTFTITLDKSSYRNY